MTWAFSPRRAMELAVFAFVATTAGLEGLRVGRETAVRAAAAPSAVVSPAAGSVWARGASTSQAWLPALDRLDQAGCRPRVVAMNAGVSPAKMMLVTWGPGESCPDCAGPRQLACSGLVMPGGTWTFEAGQVAEGAASGAVFSLSTRSLAELGLPGEGIVADHLCETLAATVTGDCDRWGQFLAALGAGYPFAGLPLDQVYGGPLAVTLNRSCGAVRGEEDTTASMLRGYDVGPVSGAKFDFVAPLDSRASARVLHAQNIGTRCATVYVLRMADCQRSVGPEALSVAPGSTVDLRDPAITALSSTQPMAVVVDTLRDGDWTTTVATASPVAELFAGPDRAAMDSSPAQPPASGAMLVAAPLVLTDVRYGPRGTPRWRTRILLQNLSSTTAAEPRIRLHTRLGQQLLTLSPPQICPLGTREIELDPPFVPEGFQTLVFIESHRWWAPEADPRDLPRLGGTVTLYRSGDGGYSTEAAAYNLVSMDGPQVGQVALPFLGRGRDDHDFASELFVANLAPEPGTTYTTLHVFDHNGPLGEYSCLPIDAELNHFILEPWPKYVPGFRGTLVVSANYWQHPSIDLPGQSEVRLSTVVLNYGERSYSSLPQPAPTPVPGVPRESAWVTLGAPVPLGEWTGGDFALPMPECRFRETSTPTAPVTPSATPSRNPTRPVTPTPTPSSAPPPPGVFLPWAARELR